MKIKALFLAILFILIVSSLVKAEVNIVYFYSSKNPRNGGIY